MVLHNSIKLWAGGTMEMKWCLEKLFFYLSRGLMLLMDVSAVQSACSALCAEICVFISLPSPVIFAFFVRRGKIPSYGLGEFCLGEYKGCMKSELIHYQSQERIKHHAPAATARQCLCFEHHKFDIGVALCWRVPKFNAKHPGASSKSSACSTASHKIATLGYFRLYVVCGTTQTIHSCGKEGKNVV